jgi:cell division transport system permease protein
MKAWLVQHGRAMMSTLGRMARTPLASVLNVGVIGVALALPLAFYAVLANLQGVAAARTPIPQLSLFMTLEAQPADVQHVEARLKKHADVASYRFVSRASAFEELKAKSGLADVLASLPGNPLPDAFVINTRDSSTAALEKLRDEFKTWPRVEHVQLDSAWARRLDAALSIGRLAVWTIAGLLGLALVAVTFNTIRLQILTQRAQIEVAKLIGATDGYVRRPFLYYGALLGLLGAVAACLIVVAGAAFLNTRLDDMAVLYGGVLRLSHLGLMDNLGLCAMSAGLGWLGAWLSADHHLAEFRA